MERLMGSVLVVLGCVGSGLLVCVHRKRQRHTAQQLTLGLKRIVRTLDQTLSDTETLLLEGKRGCSGSAAHFFERIAAEVAQAQPLSQAWQREAQRLELSPICAELLQQAGGLLGQYEAAEQRAGLSALTAALDEETKRAKEEEQQFGRLSVALGGCAAVFLLALLL